MKVVIDGVQFVPKVVRPKGKPISLGEMLRFHRELNRWTINEAAERSDLSKTYFWQLETGQSVDPSFSVIVRIAALYGIELDVLAATPEIKAKAGHLS